MMVEFLLRFEQAFADA